ncbi:hypothetical protein D3C77_464900 [compost metagenome]
MTDPLPVLTGETVYSSDYPPTAAVPGINRWPGFAESNRLDGQAPAESPSTCDSDQNYRLCPIKMSANHCPWKLSKIPAQST